MAVRLHVWGERACFTRPELKVERVSYDVPTPTAARGILEAIHWKPAIRWQVDRIHVLREIRFQSLRRNEVGAKASAATARSAMNRGTTDGLGIMVDENRQQRAAMILVDVAYVIEAHFEMTAKAGPEDTPDKHINMFNRRARAGQCFHRPCLGTREFVAEFELIEDGAPLPESRLPTDQRTRDLGLMLHDIDFSNPADAVSHFYRARMVDGVIAVPPRGSSELVA
ncbi:type I-C CRISPR-associated protein Cas5c [uncultured Sphingomonas sp.]|uniref:type I-C CRISPR-associated protein Cas5c n=1 Tax=uncultured Sphingomonas sp. TaxID=158754 RepID=UPI0035CB402C